MAGTALFYDTDAGGKARNAHVGAIGVGDRPQRLAAAEAVINGRVVDVAVSERAGAAASAAVDAAERHSRERRLSQARCSARSSSARCKRAAG